MNVASQITIGQAFVLAIVQGITELFPLSSLGHATIIPHLLGWQIDQTAPSFLPFVVTLHLGTAMALLMYFWQDWWALLKSLIDVHDALSLAGAQIRKVQENLRPDLDADMVPVPAVGVALLKHTLLQADVKQVVAVLDPVTFRLVPLEDGAFLHGLAEKRKLE